MHHVRSHASSAQADEHDDESDKSGASGCKYEADLFLAVKFVIEILQFSEYLLKIFW
jgi:hypothetical protein